MKNRLALERYPGLFWNQLEWEQCSNGESPRQFYERIHKAWSAYSEEILSQNADVVLVTHAMDEREDVKTVLACARRYFAGELTTNPVWEIMGDKPAKAVKDITSYLRGE